VSWVGYLRVASILILALASSFCTNPISKPDHNTLLSTGDTLADLSNLRDEPSRADLFKRVKTASGATGREINPRTHVPFKLLGPFVFPTDAIYDRVTDARRENCSFGVDISHYTPTDVPLEKFSGLKIRFVYCKATQGATLKDGSFGFFWKRLGALPVHRRVLRGAYHFLSVDDDSEAQATTFMRVVSEHGGIQPTDMPPVVDLEWDVVRPDGHDRWEGHDPDQIINSTLRWMELVEAKTGRAPMLYTSNAWWQERIGSGDKFDRFSKYRIWIADYSRSSRAVESPEVPNGRSWALWQFTDSARLRRDFESELDASIYENTEGRFDDVFDVRRFDPKQRR
jgi:lysozyme